MWKQRAFRWVLAGWLFFGHGLPKLASWFFDLQTWGPHAGYQPRGFFSASAAIIEFVCPLLIILGFKIKWNATAVACMLLLATFSKPFPWLHILIPIEGYEIPFAIIPSHQLSVVHALAFLSLLFFAQDESWWRRKRS